MPYLPIDPKDVGRTYDSDVIRINSQSGKGGVAYVLKQNFGIVLPDKMREEVGYLMKGVSDHEHAELSPDDMFKIFRKNYSMVKHKFDVTECHFKQDNGIIASVTIKEGDKVTIAEAKGNGRLNAVNNAIRKHFGTVYHLAEYEEHSLSRNSNALAICYVGITTDDSEKLTWGVGTDEDIITASIHALVNAVNKTMA